MEAGKKLHSIINGLRYFGVGAKVTRNIYKFPDTYWIISKVILSKNSPHGKIYGKLIWRGLAKEKEERITTPLKKQWLLLELPSYTTFHGKKDDIKKLIPTNIERTV